jgi:hypothetical protein
MPNHHPILRSAAGALALALAACDPGGGAPAGPSGPPLPPVQDREFPLAPDWVKAMLEENDKTLARMKDRLDSMRRELERMDASPAAADLEEARTRLRELLDKEEADLQGVREKAADMRRVLEPAPPAG